MTCQIRDLDYCRHRVLEHQVKTGIKYDMLARLRLDIPFPAPVQWRALHRAGKGRVWFQGQGFKGVT